MTTTLESPYIPDGCYTLDKCSHNIQLRLGIQGYGGTGKSFGATTFQNPIFLSFDRGLIAHLKSERNMQIAEVPFFDTKYGGFVDKIIMREAVKGPPNFKEALVIWLRDTAPKLKSNQTLVIDGNTGIQAAYHIWFNQHPELEVAKNGEINKYKKWGLKLDFYMEIMSYVKGLQCDVIYICHEHEDRNDKGDLNGLVRPLLSGQFQDELLTHFTDWYRAIVANKPPKGNRDELKKFQEAYQIDDKTAQEWIQSTPDYCKAIYLWQTQSDKLAKCKTSLVGAPKYILQNSKIFNELKRKPDANI